MKNIYIAILINFIFTFNACSPTLEEDEEVGTVVFIVDNNYCEMGNIIVELDGQTKTTIPTSSFPDNCRNPEIGAAFKLRPGTYSYHAYQQNGNEEWSGIVIINDGFCDYEYLICSRPWDDDMGQAVFFTRANSGWSKIDVSVNNNYAGSITNYVNAIPDCEAIGSVTVNLPPGEYPFTAQSDRGHTWSGNISINDILCSKMELTFSDNQEDERSGKVSFFAYSRRGWNAIDIKIDEIFAGTLRTSFTGRPTCDYSGNVNKILNPGTYPYTAVSDTNLKWEGFLTIFEDQCSYIYLNNPTANQKLQYAKVTFWTSKELVCNEISVTLSGVGSKFIRKHSVNGATPVDCNQDGYANFEVPPGRYIYIAQCGDKKWEGTISLNAQSCSNFELR